jgi:hypothetical protein
MRSSRHTYPPSASDHSLQPPLGIDHPEAQPSKFRERTGLPRSRHPSDENPSHRGQVKRRREASLSG